jgi:pSer/pThr/pTyr-binding forkhead associated (FHA) protein
VTADPRLNSLHLEAPRRQDYRRAREALLQARGCHTLCAENRPEPDESGPSNTLIQNVRGANPTELDFWLADDEYIYPLKVGLNVIGRAPENDVVVPDAFISRRHCAILVHAGRGCELHDTASKNGTFLNGAKLARPTPLKSGDEIRICERQFVFVTRDGKRRGTNVTATLPG